ncbi:hypothetical protein I551_0110 [Mycobacterium ulcerans str. Harvey]|uniref:Uncharacterized protein n=1 Tax=Mycobacterium ulcerans str. Harvey TaxID=1299332 RepID=A0ABP3AUF9_MYCUL|nr:hypothetical protein I551_0110 [Mycobacterium ulcerans str. Harvey]
MSYSFDVLAGNLSMTDLRASSWASAYPSSTSVSLWRSTTTTPRRRGEAVSVGRAASSRASSASGSAATSIRE